MRDDPVILLLKCKVTSETMSGVTPAKSLLQLFDEAKEKDSPEVTAQLLYAILCAEVQSTFHKINVHAAMTPADVGKHFEQIFCQANYFLECKDKFPKGTQLIVTVSIRLAETEFQKSRFYIVII